jgi:hypothetical protein
MNPVSVPRIASHQQDLFPLQGAPNGLLFEPEIMTAKEEAAFLDVIRTLPFGNFRMHGVDAKRRVVRFGVHYVAGSAAMLPASEFPLSLEPLRARTAAVAGIPTRDLSESLITEYTVGAGIGWHLVRWRLPDALSTGRRTRAADLDTRASAAISLCDERHCAGGMAAQHTAGQRTPLVDHIQNAEAACHAFMSGPSVP